VEVKRDIYVLFIAFSLKYYTFNTMDAKHQFKYTYNDTTLEEFSPVDVTFDMPGEVTITQMLWNFQCYLKACGFVFDGRLEVVPEDGYDVIDEDLGWEGEAVEEWNKGLEKLQAEVKKNKWVHGMCNPPSPDWKKKNSDSDSDNCWNS
jgi:hypothetical protein